MKRITMLSLLITVVLFACKKNSQDATPTLITKWTLDNTTVKEYEANNLTNTYIEPGGGMTLDFQKNGHLVVTTPPSDVQSVTYSMQSDSKVMIDGELYEIRNLTFASVTLYTKSDYGAGDYDEIYINLKR